MARILIVEDEEMNWDMLSRRLTRKGHEVSVANDGPTAVDKAKAERPDIILMDIRLDASGSPFDGNEATRRIKADAETAAIPIIALTAWALQTERDKALEAGSDDFVSKPIEFPTLLEKIDQLVRPAG
jgi:CheY-like chemotaxis protein